MNPIITPELYAQNTELERSIDYMYGIKDMKSFFDLSLKMKLSSVGYAFADYYFLSPGLEEQYDKKFGTNLDAKNDFQHEGILNCGALLGNDFLYGGVMRTRQSMGYGKTGNLMVGDNFGSIIFFVGRKGI